MREGGEDSSWQAPEPEDFARKSGSRRVAGWVATAMVLLGCFALFIAPMLYLSALAFKFNALWLDGVVLLTMLATYVSISRGIRIVRAIRLRMQARKVRRNAAKALDGRKPSFQ